MSLKTLGVKPYLIKFGKTEKLIFSLVESREQIGFRYNKKSYLYEASALSPLIGTKYEEVAIQFGLEDVYYIVDDNMIYLFGDTYGIKENLKSIGFSWGGYEPTPHWKAPFTPYLAKQLNEMYNLQIPIEEEVKITAKVWEPEGFTLWHHQKEGVQRVINHPIGELLAWQMGTGKSLGAFAIAKTLDTKLLCVVPAFLRLNIYEDAIKFGMKPALYPAPKKKSSPYKKYTTKQADVVIMSYTMVGRKVKTEEAAKKLATNFGVIAFDESTYIKNYYAQRTKAVIRLCDALKEKDGKLAFLSGTPTMNAPWELYTTLRILQPRMESFKEFTRKYNGAYDNGYGWTMGTPSPEALKELHERLSGTIMHRVLKEDCLDLPEKIRVGVFLENTNVDVPPYPEEPEEILGWMQRYKVAVAEAKVKDTIELVQNAGSGTLIFTEFVEKTLPNIVQGVKELGLRCGAIHGDVNFEKRQQLVNGFQDGSIDVLVIQTQTGGMGLNLFRAKNVIFNDMPWSPGAILQAEDRAHRYGADKKHPITVSIVVADDEFDGHLYNTISQKFNMLKATLDGAFEAQLTDKSVYQEMRKYYLEKLQLTEIEN